MIDITDKQSCCGCSSCVQKCPRQCISLHEDTEGFLYPVVDKGDCIDCGLCEKVCPLLHWGEALVPMEVLAVKNKNQEERIHSSSGGVFIALSRQIIMDGGVVFGAVYDENWEVRITYSETLDGVRPMMGSKYLQARVETGFADAERFLKQGRYVLFSGTPCQIAGLHKYLRKDYPNLLSVDFLCHGVPSPGVWRRYLKETMSDLQSARRAAAGKNSVLLSDIHRENPFMRGFLSDIYLRPSCYECKCKNGVSHSDLTIADFWGIDRLMPDFDDDKGIGLALVNTVKGKQIFKRLSIDIRLSALSDVVALNGGFKEYRQPHPARLVFFRRFAVGETVESIVEDILRVPLWRRVMRNIKTFCKMIINRKQLTIIPLFIRRSKKRDK